MLQDPIPQLRQKKSLKDLHSLYQTDDDDLEQEEEEETVKYKPTTKKRHQQNSSSSSSSSPEPTMTTIQKAKKKICADPNRKDKLGRSRLFSATTAGHLGIVQELIEQGANVNMKDNANWTPLHEAASHARFEIAQHLIQCGAEINVRGYGLETPLHDACQSNSASVVQLLVDEGADVFALNEKNKRPIDLCTSEECQAILKAKMKQLDHVIRRDAQGRSLLHHACINNQCEKAQDLIEQGADVNAKDIQDTTPLHLACAQGHLDVVKLLIEQGALVNILGTKYVDTPLHQASRYGQEEIVCYLIEQTEADVNIENKQGENPYRVSTAFPSIRQILTARMDDLKALIESCDALDDTARKMALQNEPERHLSREERKIKNYMLTFAKLANTTTEDDKLLDDYYDDDDATPTTTTTAVTRKKRKSTSLDPFKKDSSGSTQLHKYSMRGDCEAVESLLESGANPNEKDNAGWTSLHEASLKGHIEVVKILLKHGADVNSKGADMDTPLHDATENNHCDIVELLLDNGADPFARNVHNSEPIDIAMHHEFQDIILVLQNANPVVKKKKANKKQPMTDTQQSTINTKTKKRRLIQAADLEKTNSDEDEPVKLKKLHQRSSSPIVKLEEEQDTTIIKEKENRFIPSKKISYYTASFDNTPPPTQQPLVIAQQHPPYSPIHTPPPEQWTIKKQDGAKRYSPLYTVKINFKYYVIDLQVCLFLDVFNLDALSITTNNNKILIHTEDKIKLWPTLKHMIGEEKSTFIARELYFIALDDVVEFIKRDFNHLVENLLTITLDIAYNDNNKKLPSLPPKIAMKMKKCGYKFQQYS